ncbi:hypothetical protein OIM90_17040 [Streptomyces sp. AD16]|nr:hypothetical protein OIM90_17040 [Streptomyces sp. AD16]
MRRAGRSGELAGRIPPLSHRLPIQLVETGLVLLLAVLAVGTAFLVLRRRTP